MPYKDPEKRKEHSKKWRQKNKEKVKEYYQTNKKRINAQQMEYKIEKYHTNPCYKLRKLTSNSVRNALKGRKGGQSILPYVDWNSYEELEEHLESQFEDWMTWENHGNYHPTEKRWQIDHIIPQSVLLEGVTGMDHPKFRECWSLENLQPLEARENISKGNKIL